MKNKMINIIKETYAGIFISLCLSFMLLFYEPLNIYATNLEDFWFDIYTFFPIVLFQFLISFLLLSIFFLIIRKINKKIYIFFVVTFLIGTLCTYVQGNYLVGSLPAIDGNWVNFDTFKTEKLISILLWIIVTGSILFVLYKFKFEIVEKVAKYSSLVIVVMLSTSIFAIITVPGFFDAKKTIVATINNINDYGKDKNFIIFLVDAVDSRRFSKEVEKLGKTDTLFKDFTYYPDTLAGYPFTRNSIPFILGGQWYENEQSFRDYVTEDMNNSPLFKKLEEKNYQLNLYEFNLNEYHQMNYERFDNIITDNNVDIFALLNEEFKIIMYKYLPYQLKWRADVTTLSFSNSRKNGKENFFKGSNVKNYEIIKDEEINIVDGNNFKFFHLEGGHVPYRYNGNVEVIENGTYGGNLDACVTIIEAYLNKLKENNVYDNSVIVIMSDHGYATKYRQNPILYIKGYKEKHDYKVSDKKISYADLMDAFGLLIDDKKTKNIFENLKNDERRFLKYKFKDPSIIIEFVAKGHAWDGTKITETGNKYELKN